MTKGKILLFFVTAFVLNFYSNNLSFAIEDTGENRYPDYAYEFVGKDKCETFNRRIFIFNSKLNKYVIRPVNIVWASVMPKYGIARVQNFYTNMEYPIRLVSCLVQKDFHASKTETVRFLTNTTLGVAGLYDPAKTKFKIEPCQEDMGQALAHLKVKKGPYLVLPIIPSGNVRDIAGQVLDCPLNPSSYIVGPAVMIAKAVAVVNKTTNFQPIAKTIDFTYADPYDVTKKLTGVEKYIKNENLDRREVLAEKIASQSIVKINNNAENTELVKAVKTDLNADIELKEYNPQSPVIDSMRTAMFADKTVNESPWSELSVWNKSFSKQIKTASVNIEPNRPNYKYRYILQKDKNAPLAILYPSFGEGIMASHSVVLAKIFYDEGYSVMMQGSPFQWEFIKSLPESYKPGYPSSDTYYSRLVTSKIINDLEIKKACKFDKKVLVGTSFGGLMTLFIAAKEDEENTLGINKYISINPPIEIFFALKQVDRYSQDWKNNPSDIKLRAALTAGKVMQVYQMLASEQSQKKAKNKAENIVEVKSMELPFTDEEAKLIIGFIMKQKLSDLVFTMEKGSKSKKTDIYDSLNKMSFYDYAQKYLQISKYKSEDDLTADTSLYAISDFLAKNENYKIYHSLDDYYVSPEQLSWLKKQSNKRSVFFNNGSHLGFLYRKEFLDEFKKDIALDDTTQDKKL